MIMYKLTINEKYRNDIKRARFENQVLMRRQEDLVNSIADELGIKDGTADYEILWDHILNETEWSVDYKKD